MFTLRQEVLLKYYVLVFVFLPIDYIYSQRISKALINYYCMIAKPQDYAGLHLKNGFITLFYSIFVTNQLF